MLTARENALRNARFQGPEYIPCRVVLVHATRALHGRELEPVLARYPLLFPDFVPGQCDYDNYPFPPKQSVGELIDPWGCTWRCALDGMVGTVVEHPLADWSALDGYRPPPAVPMDAHQITGDWLDAARQVRHAKQHGHLATGSIYHGFFFMRLTYLRGFENLLCDLVERPPQLPRLMEMVADQVDGTVRRWLDLDVDLLHFGEDLGTQTGPILSPAMFAEFVTPVYRRLMRPARSAGKLVYLHSDGHVLDLLDEFENAGVDIINPQDLVNGIDNLARHAKGRFCISLDIDRQSVVPFGSPRDIHDLIAEGVRKLGDPAGGLELVIGIIPPTPIRNIEAVCEAFMKFRTYFWD